MFLSFLKKKYIEKQNYFFLLFILVFVYSLFNIALANPGSFTITQSGGNTTVTEGGPTDSFTVVLGVQPASSVVFDISSNDTSAATVNPAQITFTNGNWNTLQTITVTAPQDPDPVSENVIATVTVNDALSDNFYDPLPDQTVNVSVIDNDLVVDNDINVFENKYLPVNIGSATQRKSGAFVVHGLRSTAHTRLDSIIQIPTNAGLGKVLTSDASGNASWQNPTGGATTGWTFTTGTPNTVAMTNPNLGDNLVLGTNTTVYKGSVAPGNRFIHNTATGNFFAGIGAGVLNNINSSVNTGFGVGSLSGLAPASPYNILYKDFSFNIGTGFDNTVQEIAIQPDGKILVGGYFTTYQGLSHNSLARLNSDGSVDSTFTSALNFGSQVQALSLQSNNKIIVAYDFTLARLNSDGSVDSTFNVGSGFNNFVYDIAIQSDGKILVAGEFTTYQGVTRNRLVRLNSDGSVDSTFNVGTGFNNLVNDIAIQTNGQILVAGEFTTYQGSAQNRLIRLSTTGTKDATFNIGTGCDQRVSGIIIQTDNKLLIYGACDFYQGVLSPKILRLNTNGSRDFSLMNGSSFNLSSGPINSVALQSDGKILAGGNFSFSHGLSQNNLVRVGVSGTNNTAVGFNALSTNITGSNNTAIGSNANVSVSNLNNATAIGNGAIVNASNKVRIGNSTVSVIEGQVAWSFPSDLRLKKNIKDLDLGLDFVKKLRPVSFKTKTGDNNTNYGFIAQEVEGVLKKYNQSNSNLVLTDIDGYKTMRYTDLLAPLTRAIQEQQFMLENDKNELTNFENDLNKLEIKNKNE